MEDRRGTRSPITSSWSSCLSRRATSGRGTIDAVLRWITAENPADLGPGRHSSRDGRRRAITPSDIAEQLACRRSGYGRGARMKFEADKLTSARRSVQPYLWAVTEIGNSEWPGGEYGRRSYDPDELPAAPGTPRWTRYAGR